MGAPKPGSDRGCPATCWDEAFGFYAALPDTERSYQRVADEFRVSVRTVETHGRKEGWNERLRRIRMDAAERANEELTESMVASRRNTLKLIEATFARYAQQLQAATVKVTPADLARLVALQQTVTDTIAELQDPNRRTPAAASEHVLESSDQLEIIRALHEAGVFERLHRLTQPPTGEARAEAG